MSTPADCLAQAGAETDGPALQRLARCPYPFVWQALATNPHTPPAALLDLSTARDSDWNDNKLLLLLAEHPRADGPVLRAVLHAVAKKLEEGQRPYAAALALADRPQVQAADVRKLGTHRGASARLRKLLTLHLSSRT